MNRARWGAAAAALAALLLGVIASAGGRSSVLLQPPVLPGEGPLGPAVEALGINEAVSFPLRLELRQGPPPVARLAADAAAAGALGARWTRGHTAAWPRLSHDRWEREGRSWERMDTWVRVVQEAGLAPLAMISPWPGNQTRDATDAFVLPDPAAYSAFVEAAVERYDGDGVDDMPGLLAPLHHWEIDNEPDLKNLVDLRTGETDDFATPAQFAEVLRLTAAAIRRADADAVILGGGFNRVTHDHGHRYLQSLMAEPGVLDALDVVSVHTYHQGPGLDDLITTLQRTQGAAPGARIWLTETSVPSQGRGSWQTEAWQARLAVVTVLESLAWGVEKVFWHTLFDPPPQPGVQRPSGTRTNSLLVRTPSGDLEPKPSAHAWKALADLLEGVDRSQVTVLQARGGRAWQVGGRTVLWGEGTVEAPCQVRRGRALLAVSLVRVEGEGELCSVDVGAHGGLVVLEP